MENNCAVGEGLSYEDKLHVVCSVMGISSEMLLQRVVDRYYNMLVRHAGTFEAAMPDAADRKKFPRPRCQCTIVRSQKPAQLLPNRHLPA